MDAPVQRPAAALYVRVSTHRQEGDNQRGPLEALAAARGWAPRVYTEVESGAAGRVRPVLAQLMADAHAGRVGAVCVVALDRLGRSMLEVVRLVLQLDAWGVRVVSLREPWLDAAGPARPLLLAVFGWVAEEERRVLVERTHAGLARARAQGKHLGRPVRAPGALALAVDGVRRGMGVRAAGRAFGVSPQAVRRALGRAARGGPEAGGEGGPDSGPLD